MWIEGQNAGLGLFNLKINTSELVSIGERFICVKGEYSPLITSKASSAIRQAHGPECPVVKANPHNRQSKGGVAFDRSSRLTLRLSKGLRRIASYASVVAPRRLASNTLMVIRITR